MSRSTARGWACGGSPRRLAPCENQAPGQRRSSLQQVFDTDRQIAYAYAGGVVDRAGDGGGDAGQADFADATRTDFVPDVVGIIQEADVLLRRVGMRGHDVVGQVAVDRLARTDSEERRGGKVGVS